MIYIFQDNNKMWNALDQDGSLLAVENFFSHKAAMEHFPKWRQLKDKDIEFVTKPWEHPGVIQAKQLYSNYYGCDYLGMCK